jgi:hypothetical protein
MKEVMRLRENQPELPVVVCGDMNSNRRSLVREYMLHGMPVQGGAVVVPSDGPFSGVWSREFNKKSKKRHEVLSDLSSSAPLALAGGEGPSTWTDDSFPWQRIWCDDGHGEESLLPSRNLVPLFDAYEDLHDGKLAYTLPGEKNDCGENMILDHMYEAALSEPRLCLVTRFSFHTPELAPIIGHQDTVRCSLCAVVCTRWDAH